MKSGSLFQNRPFQLLWASEFCLTFGFSMMMTTVSWYVVRGLGESGYLGIVLAAASLPHVLMMLAGGILADRMRKSFIVVRLELEPMSVGREHVVALWEWQLDFWVVAGDCVSVRVDRRILLSRTVGAAAVIG
ncbi:MFS transporter [Brevibacillus massiliensis]|jgi:Na+/melibiose symporter-like transporter|uniref:MFS transporter n=1 Tax=Brevibacillus massiliensis TaxID=1118054 RepID=UPI00047500F1|nr:MFS transporter [Brevibacillus massiliensis]